jgi:hypothetical protein
LTKLNICVFKLNISAYTTILTYLKKDQKRSKKVIPLYIKLFSCYSELIYTLVHSRNRRANYCGLITGGLITADLGRLLFPQLAEYYSRNWRANYCGLRQNIIPATGGLIIADLGRLLFPQLAG